MIRIGIVGCGRILAAHLRGYRLLRQAGYDGFRITALCARRESDARMYARRGEGPPQRAAVGLGPGDPLSIGDEHVSDFQEEGPAVFTDYRELIASGLVDAVNDFTTHELHHQVADAAFAAGKHLLTQKPLAVSVAAARRMAAEAERQGVVFGVFENFRFREETRRLRWAFERGPLGPLRMLLYQNIGHWWAPDRIVAETPWRHRRGEGGGVTLDLGVHFFDQIRHVAGEIEEVEGRTWIVEPRRRTRDADGEVVDEIECDADDSFSCTFRTAQGTTGIMGCSWAGHGEPTLSGDGRGFCYYAERGSVIGDDVRLDGGVHASLANLYNEGCPATERSRLFPHGLDDSFALSQLDWLEAIRQGRAPETDGREGLRDLAASFAILESDRTGRRIRVADVLSGAERQYQREIDERYGLLDC